MTASARATANVANASLSTGPRTEEGKARSSRNAVKHGLTAKHLVIAPGEEQEFAELHDALFAQLAPRAPSKWASSTCTSTPPGTCNASAPSKPNS